MERLKRRSRRRHRSSYDHTRHICRSILEIAETDIDESKENTQGKFLKGVKLGRSKVFIQEDTVRFGGVQPHITFYESRIHNDYVKFALFITQVEGITVIFHFSTTVNSLLVKDTNLGLTLKYPSP